MGLHLDNYMDVSEDNSLKSYRKQGQVILSKKIKLRGRW